jgi:hypothetical protein
MKKNIHHTNIWPLKEALQALVQSKSGRRVSFPQICTSMTYKAPILPTAQWHSTKYRPAEPCNEPPRVMSNEGSMCGCSRSTSPAARAIRRQTSQRAPPSATTIPRTAAGKATAARAPSTAPSSVRTAGPAPKLAKYTAAECARRAGGTRRRLAATARRRRSSRPGQESCARLPPCARGPAPRAPAAPPAPPAPLGPSPAPTRRACTARRWRRR